MSASYSAKFKKLQSSKQWRAVSGYVGKSGPTKALLIASWTLFSFVASVILVSGFLIILDFVGLSVRDALPSALLNTIAAATIYVLALVIAIGAPYAIRHYRTTLADLGLHRLMTWTDIGLSTVTFFAYILVSATLMAIIIGLFPGFPAEQAQDTGFSPFGTRLDSMLAFLTLVVIAPVAEEVLFRGYLYGKVKRYIPAIWGAILTSLLFAFVHFQWNVALDVFVLGMLLCGLRSLTGSIWAGVLLHIIKNGIAYFLMMNPMLSALG